MKIYVASKFDQYRRVQEFYEVMKGMGHENARDWTHETITGMQGRKLVQHMRRLAVADALAVEECDAFVLLHNKGGRGSFTELGMAYAYGKLIVVVGGRTEAPHHAPIFYALPEVHHFETDTEALEWLTWTDVAFTGKTDEQILEESK